MLLIKQFLFLTFFFVFLFSYFSIFLCVFCFLFFFQVSIYKYIRNGGFMSTESVAVSQQLTHWNVRWVMFFLRKIVLHIPVVKFKIAWRLAYMHYRNDSSRPPDFMSRMFYKNWATNQSQVTNKVREHLTHSWDFGLDNLADKSCYS